MIGAKSSREARALFAGMAGLGVAALGLLFVYRARAVSIIYEDAFISFRYASNLLSGNGLTFNPDGERVEGITNLLWTLLLAGASRVSGVSLPEVSLFLGVLFGALTVLLVFLWGYREISAVSSARPATLLGATVAPVLLCLAPGFAFYSASGLETGLFALLLTGGLYLLSREGPLEGPVLGSALLGLAAITRPEGALALAFGVAGCAMIPKNASTVQRLQRLLIAGLPGAAVILSFTLWRLYYYGSLLPNTAYAKAGGLENAERWGLDYLMDAAQGNWFVIAWLVALAGAALDRRLLVRSVAVLAVAPVWCAYVVYVGGDYMPFYRLIVPLLPVTLAVAAAGFARLLAFWGPDNMPFAGRRRIVAGVLAAALVFPFVAHLPQQFELEEAKKAQWQEDKTDRKEVVAWFREHDPEAVVAANGVGVLGYYTDLTIIDMLGLNDGHIARHGQKEPEFLPGHQAGDGEYVLSRKPDYIMLAGGVNPPYKFVSVREIARSPEFQEDYRRVSITLESGQRLSMFKRDTATEKAPAPREPGYGSCPTDGLTHGHPGPEARGKLCL
ncbi:hypothetical protein [Rubrobacter aplysinae]|uniref:hypothetical protein n=1 Tax=Rubrobacter aplysinae TaxID=909625 RepID=UPI00064BE3A2|nr:hypothetical protein [Rubrobacter aplysinae]